jgi:hypothetical protein
VNVVAVERGWPPVSYSVVRRIVIGLDRGLLALAHHDPDVYRDEFELVMRRAGTEPRLAAVTDDAGVVHAAVEAGHRRTLASVFGPVQVERLAYRHRGHQNLHPADAALNLPVERHSHGLRRLAAIESTRGSFEQAGAAITRATGQQVGKRQVEELTARAAADVEEFYATAEHVEPAPDDGLVLTVDAKGIVMRPDSLRPATAKAAAMASTKLATRLSKGEKRNRKRLAEVGAVYDLQPVPRQATDVLASEGGEHPPPTPKAKNKWLTASVVDAAAHVVAGVFDEADRRDPDHRRSWVALVDGNNHQIDRIKAEASTRGIDVPIVVDLILSWSTYGARPGASSPKPTPTPKHGCASGHWPSCKATPSKSPPVSDDEPVPPSSPAPNVPRPTSAPNTWSTRPNTSTTPQPWPPAGRSPPGSSRAPAGTWSPTGWTSPEHAGASPALKPCSSYEQSTPTATSTPTGNTTSTENNNESTDLTTPTTSSRSPRSHSYRAAPDSKGEVRIGAYWLDLSGELIVGPSQSGEFDAEVQSQAVNSIGEIESGQLLDA